MEKVVCMAHRGIEWELIFMMEEKHGQTERVSSYGSRREEADRFC